MTFETKNSAEMLQQVQNRLSKLKRERIDATNRVAALSLAIDAVEELLWCAEDLAKQPTAPAAPGAQP